MGSPSGDRAAGAGPPDRQTLRLLERVLRDESIVAATEYDPDSYEPRLLRAFFDIEQYSPAIADARLDVRWFTTGDFSIHYVETTEDGERWECRWDRHPNPHSSRLHVHRPPSGAEIDDLDLSSLHPLDVVSTVLAAIERRTAQLWE